MWSNRIQNTYSSFDEFESYSDTYSLSDRLGFESAQELWDANPLVQGSTNPDDYKIVEQFVFYRNTKDRLSFEKEMESIEQMYEVGEILDYEDFLVQIENFDGFAKTLGYNEDLPLADDWHVGYNRSTYGGLECLYMTHSECDFIFLRPKDAKMLQESLAQDMTPLEWKRHTQYGKGAVDPR